METYAAGYTLNYVTILKLQLLSWTIVVPTAVKFKVLTLPIPGLYLSCTKYEGRSLYNASYFSVLICNVWAGCWWCCSKGWTFPPMYSWFGCRAGPPSPSPTHRYLSFSYFLTFFHALLGLLEARRGTEQFVVPGSVVAFARFPG
jgi:hypothetical protein